MDGLFVSLTSRSGTHFYVPSTLETISRWFFANPLLWLALHHLLSQ